MCRRGRASRARLEALLAAHDQPETLLAAGPEANRPTIKLDFADASDEAVGQTLGRYKLLEREGGYGRDVCRGADATGPARRGVEGGRIFMRQRCTPVYLHFTCPDL
jgi:hypothetical protein